MQTQRSDAADLAALHGQALAFHQAGRIDEARQRYLAVLDADPEYFDSLHLLGVTFIQTGDLQQGADIIALAIRIRPDVADAHGNLANALNGLGRHQEALASSEQAIAIRPDFAQAHGNRALALRELGRLEEALDSYTRVIALKPPQAKDHFNQGVVLRDLYRPQQALAAFDRAIALQLDHAQAHFSRGVTLRDLGRPLDALASYDEAIVRNPAYADAYNNRGNLLQQLKQPQEALDSFDRAIALKPDFAEAWNNRMLALRDLKRPEDALASCEQAIALQPDYAEAHNNRASALYDLRRLDEVVLSIDRALAIRPDFAEAHVNRGVMLLELRRLQEAQADFEQAIALNPAYPEGHYNKAMCQLMRGDHAEGWAGYEWRWRTVQFEEAGRDFAAPLWLGAEDLRGKTILLHAEQGLGDALQFCRYVPLVAARGARVILEVYKGLERLMGRLEGVDQVITRGAPLPPHDFQTPLMSLPLALGLDPDTASAPYLSADPQDAASWAKQLPASGPLRVGLCWAGGARPDQPIADAIDKRRSLPLTAFAPLADLPNVQLYSLQKGPPSAELAGAGLPIIDLTDQLNDFADTAAMVLNLDLVIACDTSAAHLAGGLGKPVWVLNRFDTCWRWLEDRDDSPWYPSARLFRQTAPGDWAGVIERVKAELGAMAR